MHNNNSPDKKFDKIKDRKATTNIVSNSDKASSKKSKYANLKINIGHANAVAKVEGLNTGTIPSNTS